MNTTRRTMLIISAILVIAALVALQTLKSWANPEVSVPAYTGRGDYQRFKSQSFQLTTARGDYHRYESQFFQPTPAGVTINATNRSSLNRILRHGKSTFPCKDWETCTASKQCRKLNMPEGISPIAFVGGNHTAGWWGWQQYFRGWQPVTLNPVHKTGATSLQILFGEYCREAYTSLKI